MSVRIDRGTTSAIGALLSLLMQCSQSTASRRSTATSSSSRSCKRGGLASGPGQAGPRRAARRSGRLLPAVSRGAANRTRLRPLPSATPYSSRLSLAPRRHPLRPPRAARSPAAAVRAPPRGFSPRATAGCGTERPRVAEVARGSRRSLNARGAEPHRVRGQRGTRAEPSPGTPSAAQIRAAGSASARSCSPRPRIAPPKCL